MVTWAGGHPSLLLMRVDHGASLTRSVTAGQLGFLTVGMTRPILMSGMIEKTPLKRTDLTHRKTGSPGNLKTR